MAITITPFKIELGEMPKHFVIPRGNAEQEGTIVYWGIYLNDQKISFTSSKELAEQTKEWMENWLRGQFY